ncbi:MAG: hypothetical protein HYV09_04005 [Deltaproteobacteria bacterium]|nr:hypothetical protein [Deltaproteobacteria bacterium]
MARWGALVAVALVVPLSARHGTSAPASCPPAPGLHRSARAYRVAHVVVPLCDNEHQGIVPVSKALGDGKDLDRNLYWGAGYGFRTFFRTSPAWRELDVSTAPSSKAVLQRVAFARGDAYVVADAYDGARMDAALDDFIRYAAGARAEDVEVAPRAKKGEPPAPRVPVEAGGRADAVAFVGHDGLMDDLAPVVPSTTGDRPAGAIVVACFSRSWFSPLLKKANVTLWVGTTNLLSAESYSVEAALRAWVDGGAPEAMRVAAGKAYAKYQNISEGSGLGLFATGTKP